MKTNDRFRVTYDEFLAAAASFTPSEDALLERMELAKDPKRNWIWFRNVPEVAKLLGVKDCDGQKH